MFMSFLLLMFVTSLSLHFLHLFAIVEGHKPQFLLFFFSTLSMNKDVLMAIQAKTC